YGYGKGTLLVGGYRRSDGKPAAYSSSGAKRMIRREKGPKREQMPGPDLAAVSEESPSLPGILGTGTYSGSVVALNGTSVAAPLAVRALADAIAAGGSVEKSQSGPHGRYKPEDKPPLRLGAGRLEFK